MRKILLVEDDPFIAEIYKKKLEASDFEVTNVISGRAVLKEVLEQKFDLILLDLVMPQKDGFELIADLKNNPKLKREQFYTNPCMADLIVL